MNPDVDCTQSLSFLLVIERLERARCATARWTGVSKVDRCTENGEEGRENIVSSFLPILCLCNCASCLFQSLNYVPINSKLAHPPPLPPGHLNISVQLWSNSPPRGQKSVQMPHVKAEFSGQMPHLRSTRRMLFGLKYPFPAFFPMSQTGT